MDNRELIDRLRAKSETDFDDDYVNQLTGNAARALEAYEWQPIETAPKDGTVIFVWHVTEINKY